MKPYWSSLTQARFKKIKLHDQEKANEFIGRTVLAHRANPEGELEEVTIRTAEGCKGIGLQDKKLLRYMEINGTHVCHMLSYFTQLMENRLPTEEELQWLNDASDVTDIRSLDGTPKGKQKPTERIVIPTSGNDGPGAA